ncbi:MAG: hypothetical protein O7H41_14575 [Planctomycetota bacterium]|nr:hypothetical protein [Planctomycetota bacterium]
MTLRNSGERMVICLSVLLALALLAGACGGGGGSGKKRQGTPDLQVMAASETVTGATVTYSVTVENAGGAGAASFQVDLYYDLGAAPASGASGDDSRIIASLPGGGTQTLTFTRSATPPGNYSSWVQVDTIDDIAESDESNNISGPIPVTVVPGVGIDLAVSSFVATQVGPDLVYDVDVTNFGTTPSGAFDVDLYHDRQTAPGLADAGDDVQTISNLPGGMTQTATFTWSSPPTGTYFSWTRLDRADVVAETDETNNVEGPVAISVGTNLPELVITRFSSVVSGSTVDYTVDVTNAGPVAAGMFSVDLYYDLPGAPAPSIPGDVTSLVASLDAGASQTLMFTRTATPAGTYSSWAQVDTTDAVAEVDEGNNVAGPEAVTVISVLPDLLITRFVSVISGSNVTYSIDLMNVGSGDAGPFDLDLYYDLPGAPLPQATGDQTMAVVGLASGASTMLTFGRTATPAGTYSSWVQVDAAEVVAEGDEGNNIAGPQTVTVGGPAGADLTVTNFTSTIRGTIVTYVIEVSNQGMTDTGVAVELDLYWDLGSPPSPPARGDQSVTVPPLAAGASQIVQIIRTMVPSGTYNSYVLVDTLDVLAEADEGNNTAGPEVVTVP